MKIFLRRSPSKVAGFALLLTLVFLAAALMIFASIFYWAGSGAKTTLRNNQYNMSQAAAEAATEDVMACLMRDFSSRSIDTSSNSYYAYDPGTNIDQSTWPVQYQFSDTNGNAGRITVNIGSVSSSLIALNSQYGGLSGYAQPITLIARATPTNQPQSVTATVNEILQLAYIPLFQFAIFYNVNLEVAPGAGMVITGPVYCDQSIWEATGTFSTNVTAVGTNCLADNDPFANQYSKSHSATFQMANQPLSSGNSLTMPIGTNNDPNSVIALLEWPPANYTIGTAAAYTTNGMLYPANEADLVISNAYYGTNFGSLTPTGTNITIYYQDSGTAAYLNRLAPDFYILKKQAPTGFYTNYTTTNVTAGLDCSTNVQYAGFSFVTNTTFYDYRESKMVQAVEIDVSLFDRWETNTATNGGSYYNNLCLYDKGVTHPIEGFYVYNGVPETGTTLPAVRMVNGRILPTSAGLTVVTPFPMYVKGDYNVQTNSGGGSSAAVNSTAYTYPAALMADSITILSSSWNDSLYNSSYALGTRTPVTTTINAGMVEGIVASNTNIVGNYSGGVENFLRLEENWSAASPLWYNGAIVVLFYSQYATNTWQAPGAYYQVPTRKWAFDTNFTQQVKLPPMTPEVKAIIRGNWTATAQ